MGGMMNVYEYAGACPGMTILAVVAAKSLKSAVSLLREEERIRRVPFTKWWLVKRLDLQSETEHVAIFRLKERA
jgi:hypothetical protein